MIRDITIGQYYPVDSILHRLDPRTKIIAVFAYITSLFLIKAFYGYGVVILALGIVIKLSKVPIQFMLKGLKSIVFILIFTVSINVLFSTGEMVLVKFWVFTITVEGIVLAIKMALRLVLLILGSSLLTLTTSPIQLTDGIEILLNPFTKIGVPAHEIAMMMSIALRFIPILLEETDKIMKAQTARGADFESGSIIQRAKAMVPIMVPLFVSAFRRADELAMAMEARCYRGGAGRSRMNSLKYQTRDNIAFVVIILFIAFCIWI
ncbi:transporter [Candidatus Epulonipiscium fishelsonii]|uniref:Transporter n=1 Tax=Candidatus Epulonipiscium fishelsonii TaxID=77094 RepID=A0ACC8XAC8_9FIRM|nr:transporter [Epulopiscium sp. SCG-B11WGA-EpuloA1]ONI40106.1 transporter [Epulopiscium sp. SCG-B05WGA-EpuloA1]ONI47628.1 transporter [Epulopiscium sp. SCG-C06WGA-EpuloA1]